VTTLLFLSLVAPATGYFAHWLRAAFKDPRTADYDHTMRMCVLASAGLSLFAATALLLGL
jgi:hypothetical protein